MNQTSKNIPTSNLKDQNFSVQVHSFFIYE